MFETTQKAHFETDGGNLKFTMPIAKVDKENRIVSGFATLDNVDKQGDKVTVDASKKAFERFKGNLRLMHQPIPAGKVVKFRQDNLFDKETGQTYSGIFVDAYISKGAQNIWEMVLDGTLTSFSIGGNIKDSEEVFDKSSEEKVRVIKDYDLSELSLVDNPANQLANIFSIQKVENGYTMESIFEKSNIKNVYWCSSDELAYMSEDDNYSCSVCKTDMPSIGWIDSVNELETKELVKSLINKFNDTIKKDVDSSKPIDKNPDELKPTVSVGNYVSWDSAKGKQRGKVTRIVRKGKISIPGSSFTITGTPEDPAILVRVFTKSAEGWILSNTLAGHKMSTLRQISAISKDHNDSEEKLIKSDGTLQGGVEVLPENNGEATIEVTEVVEAKDESVEIVKSFADEVATPEANDEVAKAENASDGEPEEAKEETATEEVPAADAEAPAVVEEGSDIAKALDDLKSFVSDSLVKVSDENKDTAKSIVDVIADVTKSLTTKITEISSRNEEIEKALAAVKDSVMGINKRVEAVEEDTAVKKSGDLSDSPEISESDIKKSVWGGRFLSSDSLFK
jgi:hypothetical protein